MFTLHIPPWAPHTYVFVFLTSLTHPQKIVWLCCKYDNRKQGEPKTYQRPYLRGQTRREDGQGEANWLMISFRKHQKSSIKVLHFSDSCRITDCIKIFKILNDLYKLGFHCQTKSLWNTGDRYWEGTPTPRRRSVGFHIDILLAFWETERERETVKRHSTPSYLYSLEQHLLPGLPRCSYRVFKHISHVFVYTHTLSTILHT
jgi:hypothetical protein